jgi:parallel beta-helix repeat protein
MAMLPVNFVVGVLCALMCAACAWAGEVIPVTQTGAKPGDGADDTAGVRAAIRLCRSKPGSVLRFPKGRYDFHPPEGPPARPVAMHFAGCKDLTVEGEGSELVFHGTMGAMAFNECRGVVVRNVVIDSQRPPFSIGEVIAAAGKSFDVEVWKEFPVRGGEAVEAFMEYDPETKFPMPGGLDVYHAVDSTELLRPQVLRVQLKRAVRAKVGAVMVLRHVVYGPGALAFRSSADVRVENVTIYATPGMGVTGSQSTDLHLKAVRVMNRPGTRRIMSATADATHFNACCGSIRIEDCLFEGMGDDAVNVHGMYLRVTQRLDDKTILAVVRNNWLFPPQPGHNLELIDPASLLPYDTGCVEAVSVDRRAGTHRITFARPLPQRLQAGHYLGNTAWAPKLRITGCQVRANRARGFLIQTRDALVENNTIRHNQSAGINVTTDLHPWTESIGTRDVVIRNNTFEGCNNGAGWHPAVINVFADLEQGKGRGAAGVHRNVLIEGNTIRGTNNAAIFICSADGVVVRNNRIEGSSGKPDRTGGHSAVYLRNSRNAEITGNTLAAGPGQTRAVLIGLGCEKGTIKVHANKGF